MDAIVGDEVGAIPHDATVDLEIAMGRIALRLAAWVVLGEQLDPSRAEELARHQREVVKWVGEQLGKFSGFLPVAFGARAKEMAGHRAVLNAYADEVIARARAARAPGDDVLGALLRARVSGKPLAPETLRGHVLGLFLAGNETTAAALSWALVQGARAPAEWAKVRADPGRANVVRRRDPSSHSRGLGHPADTEPGRCRAGRRRRLVTGATRPGHHCVHPRHQPRRGRVARSASVRPGAS